MSPSISLYTRYRLDVRKFPPSAPPPAKKKFVTAIAAPKTGQKRLSAIRRGKKDVLTDSLLSADGAGNSFRSSVRADRC